MSSSGQNHDSKFKSSCFCPLMNARVRSLQTLTLTCLTVMLYQENRKNFSRYFVVFESVCSARACVFVCERGRDCKFEAPEQRICLAAVSFCRVKDYGRITTNQQQDHPPTTFSLDCMFVLRLIETLDRSVSVTGVTLTTVYLQKTDTK